MAKATDGRADEMVGRRLSQEEAKRLLAKLNATDLAPKPTQARLWPAHRLRSSRQMLRQAIITSKTANAIAVATTVMIVANESTYITPY